MPRSWLYLFVIFFIGDLLLTLIARRHRLDLNNAYFLLNLKYGYLKIFCVKMALGILHIWFLIDPGPTINKTEIVMLYYYLLVIKLAIDMLTALRKKTC